MQNNSSISLKTETVFFTSNYDETLQLGRLLADSLTPGTIVALYGQLGSGKTVLVKGFSQGLRVTDSVTSPSFTIMNIYTGRLPVFHFDFYRLDRSANWDELGLDEYLFNEGVSFIEWPDRLENWLPENVIEIFIQRIKPGTKKSEKQRRFILRNLPVAGLDLTKFKRQIKI